MLRPLSTLSQLGKPSTCCCMSPGQRVARKYRKAHKRRLQKKEYRNLQKIVPSVAEKAKVSKVTVIEEAIRYIDELHHALAKRLQASHGCALPISVDAIEQLAQQSFLAKRNQENQAAPQMKPAAAGLHSMFPLHMLTSNPRQQQALSQSQQQQQQQCQDNMQRPLR